VTTERSNSLTRARLVLAGFGWRVFLRRYRWQVFALALAVGLVGAVVAVVLLASSGSSSSSPAVPVQPYATTIAAVPTNHVTGSGSVTVQLRGDTANVTLDTNGLLNAAPHLAHIHGLGLGTCPTAASARLHNGHLAISTGDAIRLYGSTLTSFTQWGSTAGSVPNNIDMNRYPASGNIRYKRTMTLTSLAADLIRDGDAVIVVHGIDYNFNHIYDFGALGVSDLDKTLPGEATAPALCGPLRPAAGSRTASASRTTTYVASLQRYPTSAGASNAAASASVGATRGAITSQTQFLLLCHLGQTDAWASGSRTPATGLLASAPAAAPTRSS
jgi:hypothetical protein